MADVSTAQPATPTGGASSAHATSKGKGSAQKKTKIPRGKPNHPPTSEMVNNAIKSLKERGGSSLQAIKKYVSANYKVDAEKLSPFIKKYLKAGVASGGLVQTKGKGASGSFKLSSTASTAGAEKKTAGKKVTAAGHKRRVEKPTKAGSGSRKKAGAAGAASKTPKKAQGADKKAEAKSRKADASKLKSPSKAKSTSAKARTKQPKAPKPKRTKPAPKSIKKAGSPKKK